MMRAEVTFTQGLVYTKDLVILAGAGDSLGDFAPFTRIFQWADEPPPKWWSHDVKWRTMALAYFGPSTEDLDDFLVLSDEGQIEFRGEHGPMIEKIPGAGVFSEDAKGWGYMRTLRQIGDHLYAVGGAGQVYKRLGADHWEHMDDGVLQAPDVEDRLLLADINGATEDDIYICGGIPGAYGLEGRLYHWNGKQWSGLALPTTERLTAIYVDDNKNIWICGANGTLLLGNWIDGFKDLSSIDDNQLFYSLTKFNDTMYLASNLGLFFYDGKSIQKVQTGLHSELQDANVIDAADGVLWSIGFKDIARFDGIKWERIHHPDNPPIGGKTGSAAAGKP
ncbi:hypothetical protein [Undibacterium sp. Ren11W]|uniref:hypothetical protein n=1 Tax=Undibacterium sp. Ren11W TaxID=3413045 RepID=UPI003BF3B7BD